MRPHSVLLDIVDHPFIASGLIAIVTLALALQIPRIQIDESAEGLMAEHDPARQYYAKVKERFGSDNLTVILVKADDVFTPRVLGVVRRLSDDIERIEGVTRVESLTSVKNVKGEGDALDTTPLVPDPIPTEARELDRIRRDTLGNRVLVKNIVAADGRATALTVYADPKPADTHFNQRLVDRVDALIARETAPGLVFSHVGGPRTKITYSQYILADQRTVIPLSILFLLVILFLAFRTLQGVVIPVVTALSSIAWALGLMAILKIPLTALTGAVPSLLLAIGFTEDVHMLSEYHHRLQQGDPKLTAIRTMLRDSAGPILVTSATTILGFGSLIFTDIRMLIDFGYATSLGLTANYVVTMVLLPVMLRFWPVPPRRRHAALGAGAPGAPDVIDRLSRVMERLGEINLRYRVPILVGWALLTIGSLIGWATLKVNTDLISFFPERSGIRRDVEDLHRSLAGGLAFFVVVDTGRADGAKDPALLRQVVELQEFLAGTGKVDKTVSIADYVRTMHREMHGGDPAFDAIPRTAEEVAQYLLTLEGKELAKFVDFNVAAANIVVRHNLSGSAPLSALLKKLDAYVATHIPPNIVVRATGEAILFNNASDYMAINEITSFGTTFVVIGLIHALLFMSLKAGALSLVPNVVPILLSFGLMGLLRIPLNTGTAFVATIAIGIAVDDTVHHMVTYSRQLKQHGDQRVAMFNTLRIEGRPIVYVSLALAGGFLVLTTSKFVPAAQLGLLSAFVMIVAMVGELTLTPILMSSVQLVTLWDLLRLRMNRDLLRTAPLFGGLSGWEARKVVLMGELQRLAPGEFAIRKGEAGTDMYMLVTGQVRVFDVRSDGRERVLTTLGPGAVFGEMALVGVGPRTANVVAESPVEILRLDFASLERLRRRFPFTAAKVFRNLARVIGHRLRDVTITLVQLPLPDSNVAPGSHASVESTLAKGVRNALDSQWPGVET